LKILLIIATALAVNLGMFLLMDNMVSQDRVRVVNLLDAQQIEFVRAPMEEETRSRDRRRPPPPKPQEIDRPQTEVTNIAERAASLPAQMSSLAISSLLAEGGAGVAIGRTLVGGGSASDLGVMMADDLIPLSMLPPQYPPSARQRQIEGWVDVIFTVNERGLVSDAYVVDSEPEEIFDRAATDAAMRWRFRPVAEDGKPTTVFRRIRINFSLQQSSR